MRNLLFIVGTGRCGSTLVHEVMARHEECGFISNIEDNAPTLSVLGNWNNALYRSVLGQHTAKGGLRFAPSEAYKLISEEVSPIYANSSRDLRTDDVTPWLERRFKNFFERRSDAQGRGLFLHKYTGWSRLGFFARIFPEAKFIHIVRDGRAVANSWLQMDWWQGYRGPEHWQWGPLSEAHRLEWEASDRSYPLLAGICWKLLMDSYHAAEPSIGTPNYLKLRFEDIVESPRKYFEQMLQFAGLPWSEEFERGFARQAFKLDRRRAFEQDLSAPDVERLNASLRPLLNQYGYE
ncbi:MAG TPA: sulfotransferase [Burkholderiales bacterium]|nr:sulfotransferase [Burkholderiales bacterium]